MTSFPTSFGRTPNLMGSQLSLSNINRTSASLFHVGQQLTTGRSLIKPSDDSIRAATIATLDTRLERSDQILKNLGYAGSSLDTLDLAVADASDLVNDALGIASAQIGSLASSEEREGQAVIVDSMLDSLLRIANRDSLIGHVFGGSAPGRPPINQLNNAYQFIGERGSLFTDVGLASGIPVTLGADSAIGALSARVSGSVDLDPQLSLETRLANLDGARGLGSTDGAVEIQFGAGPAATIDLTGAKTIDDVVDALTAGIEQYEIDNSVSILGPGGIGVTGEGLTLDVPAGSLLINDLQGSYVAADLGIANTFDSATVNGAALGPQLTLTSQISDLQGLAGPLGTLELSNNGKLFRIDLSAAQTVSDLKSLIEQGGTGVRVEINEDGTGININTTIAGTRSRAMSIGNTGTTATADLLGVRTFAEGTPTSVLNDGRGVQALNGATDEDGNPAPEYDVDFTITLGDGFEIDINLDPSNIATIGDVVAQIESQADAVLTAASRPTTDLTVIVAPNQNGIMLAQNPLITGLPTTASRNNSTAAEQLGLLDLSPTSQGGQVVGADTGSVRVDNLFTALLDLSEALRDDSEFGIQLASDRLQTLSDDLAITRGLVGGYGQRVTDEIFREEDKQVLDASLKAGLFNVDFAAAATQMSLLQVQLQAGLQIASTSSQLTLLSFLG
ncbi:MAG: flagellin-like hook-associated protein FlgL [Phycisphaerales bacterium]|jgi:flagellin-like hook-associated protein FlgL